ISRRRALATGAVVAGASVPILGAACSSDSDKSSTPTTGGTSPAGTQTAASSSTSAPKPSSASATGGIGLQFGTNFNPCQTGSSQTLYFAQVFNSLFEWAFDGKARPALAERVESAPDGLSMTFKLRPNVEFHRGGTLTSEDVAF